MKHNYLMSIRQDDWDDLVQIRKLTQMSFAQLMRQGLRSVIKEQKEGLTARRKMRETLCHMQN